LLLIHESLHGDFLRLLGFIEPSASDCGIPCHSRALVFISFLNELGYDGESRYLAVNEFQAYLMQQPVEYTPAYFARIVDRFGTPGEHVPARAIAEAARSLSDYLQSKFGICAGETLEINGESRPGGSE